MIRKRLLIGAALAALVASPAQAQLITAVVRGSGGAPPPSYTGPGDVAGATYLSFHATFAYTAAKRGTRALNVCLTLSGVDVTCADVNSDATTGLVLNPTIGGILCGSNGAVNLCTVKTAYDQTGNGFDETPSSIAARPVLSQSASGTAGMVSFDCQTAACVATNNGYTPASPQPFTLMATYVYTNGGTNGDIIGTGSSRVGNSIFGTPNQVYAFDGTTINSQAATDNAWHCVQVTWDNPSGFISIDGTNTSKTWTATVNTDFYESIWGVPGASNASSKSTSFGYAHSAFPGTVQTNISNAIHTIGGF